MTDLARKRQNSKPGNQRRRPRRRNFETFTEYGAFNTLPDNTTLENIPVSERHLYTEPLCQSFDKDYVDDFVKHNNQLRNSDAHRAKPYLIQTPMTILEREIQAFPWSIPTAHSTTPPTNEESKEQPDAREFGGDRQPD